MKNDSFSVFSFFIFGLRFGSILGAELKSAMMRQDGLKKDIKSLKVPKSNICKKKCFSIRKPYFLSPGGSQGEHKTLKTALKRHLKSFKTQKIRGPKIELKNQVIGPIKQKIKKNYI